MPKILGFMIVAFIIFTTVFPSSNHKFSIGVEAAAQSTHPNTGPEFRFTPHEFVTRFNQARRHLDIDLPRLRISDPRTTVTGVEYNLLLGNPIIVFTATTYKNKEKANKIFFLRGVPKEDLLNASMSMLMEIRTILAAIENPNMSQDDLNLLLHNVGVLKAISDDEEKVTTIKNVKYKVSLVKLMSSVWFSAKPVR